MMTKDQDTCILLFVKYPEKGKVKLRLSRGLNEEIVQELYRCFVQDTLTTIKKIDAPFFICFHPPEAQSKFQSWLGSTLRFLPQQGEDLGERMKNSFTDVLTKGFQKVILMGSDSPDLPEDYIKQAFTTLQTKDAVLGPTVDGGYYLIGFKTTTFTPNVFEEIHWSSPLVFQETMMKLKQAQRSVGLLPVWSDIDTPSDLHNLVRRTRNTSFKSSNTMTYIHQHQIQVESNHEEKSGTKPN
ncbi:MAG TPA: TIGR04282 family arsenosugar biosynthesis glycosyltransferase [Candidatus Thermoplasmatota archaeon]|nr:TIGR04282 family arsenosugar biosynthesis glycosyltransferase [Candidatus Thermoplasmatota archaeon]